MANSITRNKARDASEKKLRAHITKELELLKKEHALITTASKRIASDMQRLTRKSDESALRASELREMLEDIRAIRDKAKRLTKIGFV